MSQHSQFSQTMNIFYDMRTPKTLHSISMQSSMCVRDRGPQGTRSSCMCARERVPSGRSVSMQSSMCVRDRGHRALAHHVCATTLYVSIHANYININRASSFFSMYIRYCILSFLNKVHTIFFHLMDSTPTLYIYTILYIEKSQ